MTQRILVPLDGSAGAEGIVPVLERLGLTRGATLILLHIVMPTVGPALAGQMPMVGPSVLPADVYEEEREQAAHFLDEVHKRLTARGLVCESAIREGPPVETIVLAQTELGAELVAMATHGRSGIGRLLLGSVAEAVMRRVTVPILVTRLADEDGGGVGGAAATNG